MKKLWIPGGKGMLGQALADLARTRAIDVVVTDREVDITDAAACIAFVRKEHPTVVVNCAAYTKVDPCEGEEELARSINGDGAGNVGKAATAIGARALHISTDYVFDGNGVRPYLEDDPTGPLSAYGRTKLFGERAFLDNTHGEGLVVRTSWLYGPGGKNFVTTMLKLMGEREELRVVADQRGRPTSTGTLASALLALSPLDACGVVHYADGGETTWHAFACAIFDGARARGVPLKAHAIHAIKTADFPTPARRPPYSVLNTARFSTLTGAQPEPWTGPLSRYLDALVAR